MKILAVVPGPATHGVVRHGLTVARLVAARGGEVTTARSLDDAGGRHDLTHAQFTDVLYAADIAAAATTFEQWAATAPRPLVVTLHDLPGGDADLARDERRSAGYRRVAAVCDAVVVSTQHEAVRMRPLTDLAPVVIALPLDDPAAPSPAPAWASRSSVGVLGFLYPGKGHEQVVRAAAGTGALVVAMGAASEGHECLPEQLHHLADTAGVDLLVTGPLTDGELQAAARAVTVPVAAYRTLGASGSLATWAACDRRPVVTATPHTRELYDADRGSVKLADDLVVAIAAGIAEPQSTWLDVPAARPDIGAAHLSLYQACLAHRA